MWVGRKVVRVRVCVLACSEEVREQCWKRRMSKSIKKVRLGWRDGWRDGRGQLTEEVEGRLIWSTRRFAETH